MTNRRKVTARSAIERDRTVVVDTGTNQAWPAIAGLRKLGPGDPYVLATALQAIPEGESGEVEDLPRPN